MHHDAFIPYEPLGTLKPIAQDVWLVDGPEIRFRYLGMGLPIPTRMTVVRLARKELFVHSPVPFSPELAAELAVLGQVRHLVAPNTLHYWWVPEWKARFPDARVFAAPGLARRAKRALAIDYTLGAEAAPEWQGQLEQVICWGELMNEVDFFFHPASRTLILTDLIENFEPRRIHSLALRALVRLAGTADPNGSAPIDMRWSFHDKRAALRAAVERMLAWEPERVVLAHGRWYPDNATAELRRAFRWVL